MWNYWNPVKIIHSDNFTKSIENVIGHHSQNKILLFVYNSFKKEKTFQRLLTKFSNIKIIKEIENEPSFISCQNAINQAKEFKPNIIIAIGGGSVIDTAKIVKASLIKNIFNIQHITNKTDNLTPATNILFIAVPTTHGTGSELTKWATYWDKKNKIKYSYSNDNIYPDYAIYDISLIKNLPLSISINTTLDSLSHAFEALWNINANPISDNYAILSIELIYKNFFEFLKNNDVNYRKNLFYASMYSGLAFSNTKTAAAHSISYPLTLYFNIPHGIACSMSLFSLLKINYIKIADKFEKLFSRLEIKSIDEFYNNFFIKLSSITSFHLKDFGVKLSDLEWLVDLSYTKGRMDNNVVPLEKEKTLQILKEIY